MKMKKTISTIVVVLFTISSWGQSTLIPINIEMSSIHWVGKKVTGQHDGIINLISGALEINEGILVGGQFEVDMTSITVQDLSGEYKEKLEGHLKSDDFFAVESFPTASLVITQAEKKMENHYAVTADLSVRGITHAVNFEMHLVDNSASSKVIIDRSKYNVKFRSGSFFENLGDNLIYDDFELDVVLKY
jgi:polyisoprenoid-binding protein YceI